MKTFIAYLRARVGQIALLLSCGAIFYVVLFAYGTLHEALLYAFLLALSLTLVCAAADFTRFYQKHKLMLALQSELQYSFSALPPTRTLPDADYCALLEISQAERARMTDEYSREKQDSADYYALWVHQIKIPISAMRLLLQSGEMPDTALLSAELFKIEQYVEMVLTYLRMSSDSTDYLLRRCSLLAVVRQAVRKYAPLFIQKKLRLNLEEEDVQVLTDEKWLGFVIEQLLSNAIKYTNKGEIHIYATADCRLIIEDSGIGIAAEDLPRICEKGFTGYNGRTDRQSTGLGLYLCRRILTRLSHKITITSAVGRGTRVTLDLQTVPIHRPCAK